MGCGITVTPPVGVPLPTADLTTIPQYGPTPGSIAVAPPTPPPPPPPPPDTLTPTASDMATTSELVVVQRIGSSLVQIPAADQSATHEFVKEVVSAPKPLVSDASATSEFVHLSVSGGNAFTFSLTEPYNMGGGASIPIHAYDTVTTSEYLIVGMPPVITG